MENWVSASGWEGIGKEAPVTSDQGEVPFRHCAPGTPRRPGRRSGSRGRGRPWGRHGGAARLHGRPGQGQGGQGADGPVDRELPRLVDLPNSSPTVRLTQRGPSERPLMGAEAVAVSLPLATVEPPCSTLQLIQEA